MSDAFEQAFLAAVDDMNAGQLHAPEHYLRTVPAARHEEFTRRLSALRAARGLRASELTSEAFEAALGAVAAVRAEAGQAGILPGALKQMRKARGIRPRDVVDALAAEYELGPEGREALREHYHQLESGELVGPNIAHRLLRSLADFFQAEFEDFRAAVRPTGSAGGGESGPRLRPAPAMGRGAGDDPGSAPSGRAGDARTVGPDPQVELVRRLFTGGPDA
ncbi:MAG TPA: hypothetical protein VGW75_04775 [Solirubrobacteraceae bacterium]|nr:hypothetical protein [Solirubrobacteraceae bacterium]